MIVKWQFVNSSTISEIDSAQARKRTINGGGGWRY